MTKSQIFKNAWNMARQTRDQHPTLRAAFAVALRATYASLKADKTVSRLSLSINMDDLLSQASIDAVQKDVAIRVARRRVARESWNVEQLTGSQKDRAGQRLAAALATLASLDVNVARAA